MVPHHMQFVPQFNSWYWTPSKLVHQRSREANRKSQDAPSVEPCYFYETYNGLAYLDIELPGVKKENIIIEVKGNHLCITAKRYKIDHSEKKDEVYQRDPYREPDMEPDMEPDVEPDVEPDNIQVPSSSEEKTSFVYVLQMRLGQDADAKNISAKGYEDGILSLAIPVRTPDISHKITIQI